jgi:hypothetical protein
MRRWSLAGALVITFACAIARPAIAQSLPASGDGIRNFGVWLDDASVAAPGGGWVSTSLGFYSSDLLREVDLPVADAGVALSRRMQFGFTVPLYNVTTPDGQTAHGIGDLYLYSKVQLRDPAAAKNHVGYALSPLVEVMNGGAPDASRSVHWALPASVEVQRNGWRAYGSGGYFSRGSLFASGAIERSLSARLWVTGTISESYSTRGDSTPIPGLARSRADISGGAGYSLRPTFALFGSVGRTISMHDGNSANLALSVGCSVTLAAPPQTKPHHRPRR